MTKKTISLIIFLFAVSSFAQDANFSASVSKNPVIEGEPFQLVYTLNTDGSNFRPPNFNNFQVLSGPSRSSSVSIINNKMTKKLSFVYLLKANKTGSLKIPSASIQVSGKRVRSNEITLKVQEPSQELKERRRAERAKEQEMQDRAQNIIADNLYIKTNVSKRNVYQGEQLTIKFKLYRNSQLDLRQIEPAKQPIFNGFWSQELESENNWERELVNGVWYETIVIKEVVLFPQRSGTLNIEPYEFKSTVRLRTNDGRRRGLFGRGSYKDFEYILKSDNITINVKDLPDDSPESFSGGVGNINMEAWLDNTKTKVNEPVTLKIKLSGKGNLKLIDAPEFILPPDLESFDPKIADNTTVNLAGMSGSIIYEYLVIPRSEGEYKIGPIEFSYFDLDSKNYKTLNSEEFIVTVAEGDGNYSGNVSGINKEELQLLGKDIRYIKTSTSLNKRSSYGFFGTQIFYLLIALPFFLFIIFILWRRKKVEENENMHLVRNKKANKIAKSRLSNAKTAMSDNNSDLFYTEIVKALWGYISDKLNIPVSDLNKDSARQKLKDVNLDESVINSFIETLDEAEYAKYSPESNSDNKMQGLYEKSSDIILLVERNLK